MSIFITTDTMFFVATAILFYSLCYAIHILLVGIKLKKRAKIFKNFDEFNKFLKFYTDLNVYIKFYNKHNFRNAENNTNIGVDNNEK